jgi:hypothetical protein
MNNFGKANLYQLIHTADKCSISLYMPTHRSTAEKEQDQIRFKNLLRQAEKRLDDMPGCRNLPGDRLASAGRLLRDETFWQQTAEGLVLFISTEHFWLYRLPIQVDELLILANRFYIKPLLALFNGDDRFYILALSQNEVRLLRCSRFSAGEVELSEVADGLRETLGYDEESGTQMQFHTGTDGGQARRPAVFHGHAVDGEDRKDEIVQYFRKVDQNVQEMLGDKTAPLVLAGVDYLLPLYKKAATGKHLLDDGIIGNPEGRPAADLHAAAWKIVKPYVMKDRQEAIARYHRNAGTGLTSSDLRQIVPAARHARVEVLFVARDAHCWGSYEPDQDQITLHQHARNDSEDLLNLAAIDTLMHGGTVYALDAGQLPEPESGAAALLRF